MILTSVSCTCWQDCDLSGLAGYASGTQDYSVPATPSGRQLTDPSIEVSSRGKIEDLKTRINSVTGERMKGQIVDGTDRLNDDEDS
eukprot:4366520-Amphidinium_carterae.2